MLLKFEEHCEPKKNVSYERYKFFSRAQESGESIDQYVTILRKLCETCEFGTLKNSLIKDRIVLGVNNTKTRERLLRVPDLTLQKALDVVRSAEATDMQMKELDSDSSVHGIGREKDKSTDKKTPSDNEEKNLQARSSIAGTVEQDMVQGSVLHMAKHVTIVKDEITSRVYADHGKKSMDWA